MKLTEQQVTEISENLQLGFTACINLDTGEVKYVVDENTFPDAREMYQEEFEEIDEWESIAELTEMPSYEAFRIMEDFAYRVDDDFHEELLDALQRRRPFANFKELVEASGYREEWFEYKDQRYIDYVEKALRDEEVEFESKSYINDE
ncbi:MAG: UPF0158 family protein [Bacteroidota bacterium]